jgi:hypothetical protein
MMVGGSTMRFVLPAMCLASTLLPSIATRSASAGPALDDDKARRPPATDASATETPDCATTLSDPSCAAAPNEPAEIEYGVGVRLRSVWVPKSVLDLFLSRAAGGAQNYGLGVDLTRRRGNTELQLGFEFEHVNLAQGVFINRGDNVAMGDEADYILGPDDRAGSGKNFGWFTVEFTFLNHAEINKWLALRYGGGLGLGVLIGEVDHYNIICGPGATNASPEPGCIPPRFQGTGTYSEGTETLVKYDLGTPVFPVVNAILGLQFRPSDRVTINLEGGLRTLPFLGISSSMFF